MKYNLFSYCQNLFYIRWPLAPQNALVKRCAPGLHYLLLTAE
jgi:hypothetical protein